VIIDGPGDVAGIYDKVHPVTVKHHYSAFEGLTPGATVPAFDLDFGRVGIQICFDISFPRGGSPGETTSRRSSCVREGGIIPFFIDWGLS
jgi:predicted amidohydrolase